MAELTPRAQAKPLRVLQDGEIHRLGENRTQRLDLRVVAATNWPLAEAGHFREDLLYRLDVVGMTASPLHERGPDVARLTDHYWKDIAAAVGSPRALARETAAALCGAPWPGNVRELQNVLANLTVTGPRYGLVGPDALPSAFRKAVAAERRPALGEAREDPERAMVRDALGRHGSEARAAGELSVARQGLSKLMGPSSSTGSTRAPIGRLTDRPDRTRTRNHRPPAVLFDVVRISIDWRRLAT